MKSQQNVYSLFRLALLVLATTLLSTQTTWAQFDEDDEDEEVEFNQPDISNDINNKRFESNLDNYKSQKTTYEYNQNQATPAEVSNRKPMKIDLIYSSRNPGKGEMPQSNGQFSSNIYVGNNTNNENGNIGTQQIVIPQNELEPNTGKGKLNNSNATGRSIKEGNLKEGNYGAPGNPGDPDAPIDGGVSLLVGAGALYGMKRLRKKK